MLKERRVRVCVLLASVGVCSISCASITAKRIQFVRAHPQLSVDRQNAIVRGEVIPGMGTDEVRASLGKPVNVTQESDRDGRQVTRWIYFKRLGQYVRVYEVQFIDGKAREVVSDGAMTRRTSGMYSGATVSE